MPQMFHFRTQTGQEVDIVLEDARGMVLYPGRESIPYGPKLSATPVDALWNL